MKRSSWNVTTAIFIIGVICSAVKAQDDHHNPLSGELEFSGFFDLQYHFNSGGKSSNYQWGQVELDIAAKMSHCITAEAAIAYDGEAEAFGIGAAFLEFNICGEDESHYIRSRYIDRSGLITGQFDVPFGIDWRVYPSLDRKSISAPLVVEETHGAWNDAGVMAFAEWKLLNVTVFHTAFADPDKPDSILTQEEMNGFAGGRIGITPIKGLEMGASYAGSYLPDEPPHARLAGGDFQYNIGSWEFKGEFIRKDYSEPLWPEKVGGYVQGLYNYQRMFALYRWDRVAIGGAPTVQRHCAGLGWILCCNAELRCEYQYDGDNADKFILQAVVGF